MNVDEIYNEILTKYSRIEELQKDINKLVEDYRESDGDENNDYKGVIESYYEL